MLITQALDRKVTKGCYECGATVPVAMLLTDTEDQSKKYFCYGCIEQKVKEYND